MQDVGHLLRQNPAANRKKTFNTAAWLAYYCVTRTSHARRDARREDTEQYLQWRYARGDDREVFLRQTGLLSDEDRVQMDKWIKLADGKPARQIEVLVGRQKWKKTFQYEVKWRGWLHKYNTKISRETLLELGFDKLVQEFDDHEASREGLGYRRLQPSVISKHFEDLGLDPEIANHNEISSLSGGQKVRLVIAGAVWNNPHLLVLDEPTNFLDRDWLGGLAAAIHEFKGGVILISHNEEFVGCLCSEHWHVVNGRVTQRSDATTNPNRFEKAGSQPGSALHGAVSSRAGTSALSSAVEGGEEDKSDMKFKAKKKKKKKKSKKELKEQEARRRLRHLEWLNYPKGTPRPPDTDEEDGE